MPGVEERTKNSEDSKADGDLGEAQAEAFNPETGEINWDCPCLGAMTKPPCGETFKAAFSCFVYSKEEPKGLDCIAQFRAMQECFREHPDIYGPELTGEAEDDDDDDDDDDDEDEDSIASSSSDSDTDNDLNDDD